MELIIVTPEGLAVDELEIANKMLANGLIRLHIRKPKFTTDEYRDYIKGIKWRYRSRLVIHGHFELFREFWLGGIHLNAGSRNDAAIWDQIKHVSPSNISTSFHSWQEFLTNDFHYGYVLISPCFDSISKPGYKAGIALSGANELKKQFGAIHRYCPKIIGLGGVGPGQLKVLHENGFDGGAMLGSIWGNEFPLVMFLQAMVQLKEL